MMLRVMMRWTKTMMSSIILILVYLLLIGGWTWVTVTLLLR